MKKRVNHDLALLNDGNCAIIVMDIRELKWINDTYGRSAGDMVINNMAANMVIYIPFRCGDVPYWRR